MTIFQKFNNFTKFTHLLISTKFYYRSSTPVSQAVVSRLVNSLSVPFSGLYVKKNPDVFWDFLRSYFYIYKLYGNFKITKVKFFKRHYTFFLSISDSHYLNRFLSFLRPFKKRNSKLFSFLYLSPNFRNFSFFLRDSHLFFNLSSDVFDFYNWRPRLFITFGLPRIASPYSSYKESAIDYSLFCMYNTFGFSNKKTLCVTFFLLRLINDFIFFLSKSFFHLLFQFTRR